MRGSILLTFDELVDDLGIDYITINVAGQERYIRYIDSNTIYTTLVNTGDFVSISMYSSPSDLLKQISIIRRDYTTDDQGGDNGIRDTFITSNSGTSNPLTVTFTATTVSEAYNFEYRITSSSEICLSIGSGFTGTIFPETLDIELTNDSKLYVAGIYNQYSGISVNPLVRLNINGTLDNTFNYTGFSGTYVSDVKQTSNNILIINDLNVKKLNTNGDTNPSFYVGTFTGPNESSVNEERIEVQSNDTYLIGGGFTGYTNTSGETSTKFGLVKLNTDGSIDNTFNSGGIGFNIFVGFGSPIVSSTLTQSDGKILVCGKFSLYNSIKCNNLVRLNSDGTLDNTFTLDNVSFPSTTGSTLQFYDIALQSDGKILVSGVIGSLYLNNSVNGLFRLNSDGTFDSSFNLQTFGFTGGTGQVLDIFVNSDDSLFLTGIFDLINSNPVDFGLIKFNSNGTIDTTWSQQGSGIGFSGISDAFKRVTDIEIDERGNIYLAGSFNRFNGTVTNKILKLLPNGNLNICP
jgi:uncharacterized delta-60 repeat protein